MLSYSAIINRHKMLICSLLFLQQMRLLCEDNTLYDDEQAKERTREGEGCGCKKCKSVDSLFYTSSALDSLNFYEKHRKNFPQKKWWRRKRRSAWNNGKVVSVYVCKYVALLPPINLKNENASLWKLQEIKHEIVNYLRWFLDEHSSILSLSAAAAAKRGKRRWRWG